jgi:hypothetical protein
MKAHKVYEFSVEFSPKEVTQYEIPIPMEIEGSNV